MGKGRGGAEGTGMGGGWAGEGREDRGGAGGWEGQGDRGWAGEWQGEGEGQGGQGRGRGGAEERQRGRSWFVPAAGDQNPGEDLVLGPGLPGPCEKTFSGPGPGALGGDAQL